IQLSKLAFDKDINQFPAVFVLAYRLRRPYHPRDSCAHTIDLISFPPNVWEDFTMSNAKHAPKREPRGKAVPVLGAAGLLSLAGGASAATGPAADLPTQKTAPNHEITLAEEELSDVSLSTFFVF